MSSGDPESGLQVRPGRVARMSEGRVDEKEKTSVY